MNVIQKINEFFSANEDIHYTYTPTMEDIEVVKEIAYRLRGNTDKETLNNILEWEYLNIYYWKERAWLSFINEFILFFYAMFFLGMFYIIYFYSFMFVGLYNQHSPILTLITLNLPSIFSGLTVLKIFDELKIKLGRYFTLFLIFIPVISLGFFLILIYLYDSLGLFALIFAFFFGGLFGATTMFLYCLYKRYKKYSTNFFKILEIISDTFKSSLPIYKILEYRAGVCRDFAKLTASLLYTLYPNNEIYLVKIPNHIATGIEINNKLYILDQSLPIMNEDAWLNLHKTNKATLLKLKREEERFYVEVAGEIKRRVKETVISSQDLSKLILEVNKATNNRNSVVKYILKNKGKLYDISDEIIKESLLRYIKIYLHDAFISQMSKLINNVDITSEDDDLIIILKLSVSKSSQ